ncbi:hypothetical protein SPRG_01239 [Saprolegnia parasitica CBS 223.65]|uniref:Uncharacterized protein n=1 Tax=Saprolegnia parasitica (strain CBS 223.65) TaxID=695850 RepID=A0A067D5F9_SAPPC|nr:hypothetical protein SPRG_01239 [Saprolegnia parasitica CBS 223.65]KDO33961.1 hypothetical protein SPRG_01239 [Saprolegnia parasitica CBS 223.65]|eukprot:XP_012194854.1 hypothetical protein SPRG_01239 [Saprolegnia parasitica CBS 223.65]
MMRTAATRLVTSVAATARPASAAAARALSSAVASNAPWYRVEISGFLSTLSETTATDADYARLAALPQRDDVMAYEVQVLSDSVQHLGTYLPASRKKQIETLWAKTLGVLDTIDDASAKADAYTAAFQALAVANAPSKYMEHLLKRMQGEHLEANPTIHIAMLHAARDRSILQVLRRVKAAQMGAVLLDADATPLSPREVQNLHYRAQSSFVKSLYAEFMSSTTKTFALESYAELLKEIAALLPPLDDKLMERTVPDEYMDKLAAVSVRALAMTGRHADVLARLDALEAQYAGRSARVPETVYLAAIEGLSAAYHNLTMVSERQLRTRNQTEDVQLAPSVRRLQKVQATLEAKLSSKVDGIASEMADLPWADVQDQVADAEASKEYIQFVQQRVRGASVLESFRLLTQDAMAAGDAFVDAVAGRYAKSYPEPSIALHTATLKQYFVAASRYERRLKRSGLFADALVARIFSTLDAVAGRQTTEADVVDALHYAFRALALLYRLPEARRVLEMKSEWFPHLQPTVAEYDDLIMLLCATKTTRIAEPLALLQEMHNRGLKPTPLTLHRFVTFRMLALTKGDDEGHVINEKQVALARRLQRSLEGHDDSDSEDEDEDEDEDEEEAKPTWDDVSLSDQDSVADVISFLQDWHNMTGVVPYGKTVVPLVEYCAAKPSLKYELSRFVLWLQTLPLDAATKTLLRPHEKTTK